jgi:hypothetical protein
MSTAHATLAASFGFANIRLVLRCGTVGTMGEPKNPAQGGVL